jgi:hypothetical protein
MPFATVPDPAAAEPTVRTLAPALTLPEIAKPLVGMDTKEESVVLMGSVLFQVNWIPETFVITPLPTELSVSSTTPGDDPMPSVEPV